MKISTNLSLTFSLLTGMIFITFGILVYLLSSNHRKEVFRDRLEDRVIVTEKLFLERDSFNDEELETIRNEFLHTLPDETEEVVEIIEGQPPLFSIEYPATVVDQINTPDFFDFEDGRRQGKGRVFQVEGKNYLILVTAIDQVGLQNLRFLRNIMIILGFVSLPILFLGSFFTSKRALTPINKKIAKANLISASNLHQRLNVYNPKDELGTMAIAFNNLLDRLEDAFEAQNSFIRNASHEIRNPLTAIMGEAEFAVSKTRTQEEYIRSLEVIIEEAEMLNSTVNNLLNLSKVDTEQGTTQKELFSFDDWFEEIKAAYDFINPSNQIEATYAFERLPEVCMVYGNKNLLKTAILNLLDNACKYSENQKVEVTISKIDPFCCVLIKDAGIGILEEDLEKIKSPFYRGDNARKVKGTGIGLSLTCKIVELHEGEIEINSKIDEGTQILVKLPLIMAL